MFFSRRREHEGEPGMPELAADESSPDADAGETTEGGSVEAAAGSQLRRRARRERSLLSLLELSNELNVRMDLYEIADIAIFNLLGHFGCSRGALWILPDNTSRDAVLARCQGLSDHAARAIGAVWTKWLLGRPGGLLEPVLVSDMKELGSAPGLALAEENGIALFAPVSARRKLLGLIGLGQRVGGGDFGPLDREVLQASVNYLGVALENTNLFNRTIESHRQLRAAYDQLSDLDRLKSEFLRNMNHELRTPLTVMAAYLDGLILAEAETGTRREHLEVIRNEADKLQGMLLNLLDFSKLLENDFELQPERSDAKNVLEKFHKERRPGVSSDLRELRFSAGSDVPPAVFDPARLVQIVDILVENAVKFTPQGSVIHLRVDRVDEDEREWLRVLVEDDGPGIPEDRLPHIFDSFRQGDGSETRRHGGMGMGLAFAKRLAEKMDAGLDVRSEIGRGTVFTIRIPV